MEESFEQIAKNLATYWNDVDGNLPAWKEVPAEEKVAYLANFAGSMDVSYPRFEAGVHSMLEIAELNGYERDLGASVEDVCRAAYQEANGNPENRFPATPEEPSNPEPAMKLRDAINQDFFLLRAAAEGTKTPLDNYLNDSDHVDLDATLTYREHFELVGKLWNEATGISRNAQSELDTVKGEVMKLVDRLGNPEVEEVGYVRLWEQPVMAEEIEPEVPAIPQERAEAERMAQADQARQDERDRERAEDAWEMRETNEIKSLEDLMAKKLPKEPSREIDMEIER